MGSLICRIDASRRKKKAHPQPSDLFRAGLDTPLRLQGHVQVSHVQKSTSTPIQLFLSCTMYVLSHFSHIQLFATLWTVALQAPLSMRFSRQEYWVGRHFLFQRIFLTQGSNPCLLRLLHWQAGSLPLALPGKPERYHSWGLFWGVELMIIWPLITEEKTRRVFSHAAVST